LKNLFRNDDYLLVNKYMPNHVADLVLPNRLKSVFLSMVERGEAQSLLLNGPAGVGKTSTALCLANDLDADVLFINASLEGNLDLLRNKVADFATSVSMTSANKKKMIILDEIEGSATPSFQLSLRGIMEKYSNNVIFVLTTNFKNRIIAPLLSRCNVIDFIFDKDETVELQAGIFERLLKILEQENIECEPKLAALLVKKYFPDFRRLLNEVQKYVAVGKIDSSIMSTSTNAKIDQLMGLMKEKRFTDVRKWIASSDIGDAQLFKSIYDMAYNYIKPHSIPELVVIVADYQYKAAFAADAEINLMACLVTIMAECEFE